MTIDFMASGNIKYSIKDFEKSLHKSACNHTTNMFCNE